MYLSKKFFRTACAAFMMSALLATTGYAEEVSASEAVEVTEAEDVGFQSLNLEGVENEESEVLGEVSGNIESMELPSEVEVPRQTRDVGSTDAPVFNVNGNLDEAYDIYLTTLPGQQLAFFKLESSNSDLAAIVCEVSADGTIDLSTGAGMMANSGHGYVTKPAGTYAIVITGSDAGGDYKLYWNASNPAGAKYILNVKPDLSRIDLFYSNSKVCSNGTNILSDLSWDYHETWQQTGGYTARDMSMKMYSAKGIYKGSFSSSAYSAPNALLVDVKTGSWLYSNSFYMNVGGDVTHQINYIDPSGLKTPRTFGEGYADYTDHNFIIIDLDKFQVCEFLSPFNYFYTEQGGRKFTLNNLVLYPE